VLHQHLKGQLQTQHKIHIIIITTIIIIAENYQRYGICKSLGYVNLNFDVTCVLCATALAKANGNLIFWNGNSSAVVATAGHFRITTEG
jgi:hypothetical protein